MGIFGIYFIVLQYIEKYIKLLNQIIYIHPI